MDDLIYNQYKIPKEQWRYGFRSSAATGCGWIATYNALRLMGYMADPEQPIQDYERQVPLINGNAGTVLFAGWDRSLGWCVKIDHGNGIISIYGHGSSLAKTVYAGKKVYQGEVIAYVGSTGNSTGNHLHFALYKQSSGTYLDPQKYL